MDEETEADDVIEYNVWITVEAVTEVGHEDVEAEKLVIVDTLDEAMAIVSTIAGAIDRIAKRVARQKEA